jgi:hypothetical protein
VGFWGEGFAEKGIEGFGVDGDDCWIIGGLEVGWRRDL